MNSKQATNKLRQRVFKACMAVACMGLASVAFADNNTGKMPDPLPLDTALEQAARHPRAQLETQIAKNYPRKLPLYLNCHNLAYNNGSNLDPYRDDGAIELLLAPETAQQLTIMARFFDVDLADLSLMHDNEAMAIAYIDFDRASVRQELKQYSETFVAELDARFHQTRQQYFASQASQQLTRFLLAESLNHMHDIPRDLQPAKLPKLPEVLPEVEAVVDYAHKHNDWLGKLADKQPDAEKQITRMRLKQHAQELLLRLKVLKAAFAFADKESYCRDLNLEKSRTLYEQEVNADLGDSMAQQTRSRLEMQRSRYCQTLTWAQLNAIQGKPLLSTTTAEAKPPP